MNCLDKMKTLSVVTHVLLVISMVNCDPCTRLESLDISNGSILANGSIVHDGIVYNSDTWYQVEEEGQLKRLGCPCIGRICLWKCCGTGRAYFNRVCNDTDMSQVSPFNPPLYLGTQPVPDLAYERFFYMSNFLCEDKYIVDENNPMEQLYIQQNATLYEISSTGHLWHSPTTYCVDMMVDNDTSEVPRMVAAVCFPETEDDSSGLYIAYAVGLLLSVPFLLATFLVYAMFSELRNVHGMCLMAYCLGLIVAYPFLAFLKFNAGDIAVVRSSCFSIAFIIYYAFQTSFFWLNVMCFDIWRTFSGYRGGSTNKRRERRRFVFYGLYAWGVPLLLTACTIFMQFSDDIPESVLRPGFGNTRCWFDNWLSELVYFFIPVLILVACNLVLFSVTAHRIRSIKQETAILKSSESARSDKLSRDKQRYVLYVKLFVVMGINWTVELVSFVVGGSNWYWAIVDLSNIMLGFFIFIIFVWKNKVRNLIMKKIRGVRAGRSAESSTGRWATRSSSAPTDDTRISSTDDALRLRDMDK